VVQSASSWQVDSPVRIIEFLRQVLVLLLRIDGLQSQEQELQDVILEVERDGVLVSISLEDLEFSLEHSGPKLNSKLSDFLLVTLDESCSHLDQLGYIVS
jgi:hypothetical protein